MDEIDPVVVEQALHLRSMLLNFLALLERAKLHAERVAAERERESRPKLDYSLGLPPGAPVYVRSNHEVRYPPR